MTRYAISCLPNACGMSEMQHDAGQAPGQTACQPGPKSIRGFSQSLVLLLGGVQDVNDGQAQRIFTSYRRC